MLKQKITKRLAVMLATALMAGTLSGCKNDGSPSGAASGGADAPSEPAKGRYVEAQESLPSELEEQTILQMFSTQDKLHLLTTKQEGEKTLFREWILQENGFEDATPAWLASIELSCGGDWLEGKLIYGSGNRQYLYAAYIAAEAQEPNLLGHLWKSDGDAATEITPEKWSVPSQDWGMYEMIQGLAALDNGTLVTVSYTSVAILSGEDGSIIESKPVSSFFYEGGIVSDGQNVYLRSSDENGGQIEKRKDGKDTDSLSIPYPSGEHSGGSGDGSVVIVGSGSLALDVLKDGTLIAANEDGIFRLAGGDPENQWEKLADGIETDFSMTDYACMDLAAMEDGSIYALFAADEGQKLNRYEYDPDAVSEVTTVLKLYTIHESSLLKQAATLYHKAHPEVRIDIEYEYPLYTYDLPDYDAVYTKLNTMLMGDDGPDICVLDHLNLDSYASKGFLIDLEELIRPLEENGTLLSNITGAYVGEDQKRYAVPLQFGFTLAMGRDIAVKDMSSMEALADFLSRADYSYLGPQTVPELVDKFYPYFCDEIVSEKQLDRDAMGKYLEYLKAIGDNCKILSTRPDDSPVSTMWELASSAKLAFNRADGFMDCMFPMSMVDYIKGDFTAFENRFLPSLQTGICTKSQYQEVAKDFLLFALSEEVQNKDYYDGFPVNKASLDKHANADRTTYTAATMIITDDGSPIEFSSTAYSQDIARRLAALCQGLDKPIKEDAKIREVLIDCLGAYLDGTASKEDTVQKIEDGLKMYLAE